MHCVTSKKLNKGLLAVVLGDFEGIRTVRFDSFCCPVAKNDGDSRDYKCPVGKADE